MLIMHKIVSLVALAALVSCNKKKDDAPAAAKPTGSEEPAAGSSAPAAAAPTPTPAAPAPPAPTPVKLTAEELKPTCPKIVTAELAAKTHGATEVVPQGSTTSGKPLAICQLNKGTELVGSITIACNPDLDPTAIERERAAMTKAKDLPGTVGRGGYRLSSVVFMIDDETPCRIQAAWTTPPEDAAWTEALRAITAAITPATLK
jgi:hypothetical protein